MLSPQSSMCRGQRTICSSQFSPPTFGAGPKTELRSSGWQQASLPTALCSWPR